ncbi:MAG: rhodanese-like domain-containing protein [Burkholderiales bacterium]|nr:rhodanese-like domain-containing protein [Burkholderiales bacterium]
MEFVQKNIWLVLIAITSGLMFIWPSVARRISQVKEATVAEAVQLINRQDAQVIDVRETGEFKTGHVPDARHIPAGEMAARTKELEKFRDKPILLVCASGNRSASAAATLKKAGFTQVRSLGGGMSAWQQAGMPVKKG